MQTYTAAQIDMVLEWIDKYFAVNALINKVFGNDNLENDSAMPSFENEIEYQRLRFWFRKNHEKFVPIWNDFCLSHGYSSQYMDNTSEMEYRQNPFLFYYDHDNLLDLEEALGVYILDGTHDANKEFMELMLNTINGFSCTAIHLAWWIGEFADTGVQFL
jgi:hypothetical protein